jgi:hypothetical protein
VCRNLTIKTLRLGISCFGELCVFGNLFSVLSHGSNALLEVPPEWYQTLGILFWNRLFNIDKLRKPYGMCAHGLSWIHDVNFGNAIGKVALEHFGTLVSSKPRSLGSGPDCLDEVRGVGGK